MKYGKAGSVLFQKEGIEDAVEEVLKCHNTSFEIQAFKVFITAENKVVLNSYLARKVVCKTESIKAIYRVMWIIDLLLSIIAICT